MEINNHLLIVDDDPMVREAYQSILEMDKMNSVLTDGAKLFNEFPSENNSAGTTCYQLVLTENGEAAIDEVKNALKKDHAFAAAFVDMMMPGINGAETARRLWALDPKMKIVIVTALSDITPDEIIQITGRDDIFYIRKPFYIEEIKQFARALTLTWALEKEQKKLHHELEKTNIHLEELVEQRTAELHKAYELLKIRNKEKSNFINYIAHEFNTPLNYISAKELIDIDKLSDDEKEFMNMIDQGYTRLRDFIKTAGYYFTISDRALNLELSDIALIKPVKKALLFREKEILNKKISVDIHIDALASVYANLQDIDILVKILVDNAIHFSEPKGKVAIICEIVNNIQNLRIIDNGKGIVKKQLIDIFVPFTIEECNRHKGGFGFNLPIAKKICDAYGWRIWAESEGIGRGAKFIVEFKSNNSMPTK